MHLLAGRFPWGNRYWILTLADLKLPASEDVLERLAWQLTELRRGRSDCYVRAREFAVLRSRVPRPALASLGGSFLSPFGEDRQRLVVPEQRAWSGCAFSRFPREERGLGDAEDLCKLLGANTCSGFRSALRSAALGRRTRSRSRRRTSASRSTCSTWVAKSIASSQTRNGTEFAPKPNGPDLVERRALRIRTKPVAPPLVYRVSRV